MVSARCRRADTQRAPHDGGLSQFLAPPSPSCRVQSFPSGNVVFCYFRADFISPPGDGIVDFASWQSHESFHGHPKKRSKNSDRQARRLATPAIAIADRRPNGRVLIPDHPGPFRESTANYGLPHAARARPGRFVCVATVCGTTVTNLDDDDDDGAFLTASGARSSRAHGGTLVRPRRRQGPSPFPVVLHDRRIGGSA